MNITLKPATLTERMYTYTQSSQIGSMTGNLGHLRGDLDSNGDAFFSNWWDCRGDLKSPEFHAEFNELIKTMKEEGNPFQSRTVLAKFCYAHPEATNDNFQDYFFRMDTEKYAYLVRLNPNKGEYNCYCYPYVKDWLDRHLSESRRGIKFLDRNYNELFRLRDGATIRVIFRDGEVREEVCRYIDPTHFEFGFGALSVFHTSQFAEWMMSADAAFEPVKQSDLIADYRKEGQSHAV